MHNRRRSLRARDEGDACVNPNVKRWSIGNWCHVGAPPVNVLSYISEEGLMKFCSLISLSISNCFMCFESYRMIEESILFPQTHLGLMYKRVSSCKLISVICKLTLASICYMTFRFKSSHLNLFSSKYDLFLFFF